MRCTLKSTNAFVELEAATALSRMRSFLSDDNAVGSRAYPKKAKNSITRGKFTSLRFSYLFILGLVCLLTSSTPSAESPSPKAKLRPERSKYRSRQRSSLLSNPQAPRRHGTASKAGLCRAVTVLLSGASTGCRWGKSREHSSRRWRHCVLDDPLNPSLFPGSLDEPPHNASSRDLDQRFRI